jgi:predicted membrane protein
MSDFENSGDEKKTRWEKRRDAAMQRHGRHGHVWTGLFILLVGVAALLKASLTDLPDWIFSWETFLILLGFFIGIRQKFRGFGWFIIMLVGGAFLITEINPDIAIHRYIWPIIIIVIGIFFMLFSRRRYSPKTKEATDGHTGSDENNSSEDFIDSTSIFGVVNKIVLSKDFKGGQIVNIFGGTELNLAQADIQEKAELRLTTTFGATILIVPSNWSVKSEVAIIFGGIDDKRLIPTSPGSPGKTLVLKGTVIFGGIEIKSF